MANLFSHPFRIDANNKVVTVDQDGDQYLAERLSVIIQTRPGERPMAPEFGMDDPVFGDLDRAELEFQINTFDLPIVIDGVEENAISDGRTDYLVNFHRNEELNYDDDEEDDF